jgi:hypothetical protein
MRVTDQPNDPDVTHAASDIAKEIVAMSGKFNPGDAVLVDMRRDDRIRDLAGDAIAEFTDQIRAFVRGLATDNPTIAELADDERMREIAYSIRSRAETIRIEGFGTLTFAPGSSPIQSTTKFGDLVGEQATVGGSPVEVSTTDGASNNKLGQLRQPPPAVVWFLAYVALEQYVAAQLHEDPASLRPTLLAAIWTALAIAIQQTWRA